MSGSPVGFNNATHVLKCFAGWGPTFDRQLRLCLQQRTSLTRDFSQKNPEFHVILRTKRGASAEPTGADSKTPIGFGEVGLLPRDLELGARCDCSALLPREKKMTPLVFVREAQIKITVFYWLQATYMVAVQILAVLFLQESLKK